MSVSNNGAITFNSGNPLNVGLAGIGFGNNVAAFPNTFNCFGGSQVSWNNTAVSTPADVCVIGLTLGLVVLAGIGAWVLQGTREEGGGLDFENSLKRRDPLPPVPDFHNPYANVQNRQGYFNPNTKQQQPQQQSSSIKEKLSRAADSFADSLGDNYFANHFKNGLAKVISPTDKNDDQEVDPQRGYLGQKQAE